MAPKATASCKKEEDLPFILSSPPQPHGLAWLVVLGSVPLGSLSQSQSSSQGCLQREVVQKERTQKADLWKGGEPQRGLEKENGFG